MAVYEFLAGSLLIVPAIDVRIARRNSEKKISQVTALAYRSIDAISNNPEIFNLIIYSKREIIKAHIPRVR